MTYKEIIEADRAAARKRGCRFLAFVTLRGETYHRTREAAERSARRRARAACPDNPPSWAVAPF